MSERNVTCFSHRLGILMSAPGRFVSCIDCHLSVVFPAGAHYDTIAKQFESHPCSIPPPNDDAPAGKNGETARAVTLPPVGQTTIRP